MDIQEFRDTLEDIIEELDGADAEVIIAYQPNYPMMVGIDKIILGDDGNVDIAEGGHSNNYLPEAIVQDLDWGMSRRR